jgi:hypothetical protein
MQNEPMKFEEAPHDINNERGMSSLDDLVEADMPMFEVAKNLFVEAQSLPKQQHDFIL